MIQHAKPKEGSRPLIQELAGLKRLWPYLRAQKRYVWAAGLLIPVISLLEMNIPIVIKWTIDSGIAASNWDNLKWGASLYLLLVVAQYLSRAAQSVTSAFAVHRMVRDLRRKLIQHVLRLSCRFHDNNMSGRMVTRATSDFDNLSESFNMGVLTSIIDVAVLAGSLIGLFYLSWKLALVSLIVLPLIGLIVSLFSRGLKSTMLRARARLAELNGFTQECLYASSTVKLLAAEQDTQRKYVDLNERYRKAQMNSVVLDAFMFSIIDGLSSITIGIVLYFAVIYVSDESAVTAGLMVAFVQYIQQMFEPVKQLSNKIAMLQGAFTSIDRVFGVLEQQDFIGGNLPIKSLKGDLSFKNVNFSYGPDQLRPTLDQLSFELPAGHSLSIVGAAGSGKSTIIKLITKLYTGYSGQIEMDGIDVRQLDSEMLRRQLAIVPQDIVIFDGSIRFNIGLGLAGISDQDIERAAQTVGADRFINELPGGYEFKLKEQGHNLSVGQRQLIAFARALAKNPAMIVLDEATSSVDPESEALIQSGIDTILTGQTVIVIAHRLSTVRKCDHIMVIKKGRMEEWGSHDELMSKKGAYFQLHQALM